MNMFPKKQQGIALPIAVILLFVMTLIGVASLRTSTLEEDMTANARLKLIASNAAAATIVDAQTYLKFITGTESNFDIQAAFLGADNVRQTPIIDSATGAIVDSNAISFGDASLCEASILNSADVGGLCTTPKVDPITGGFAEERWKDSTLDVWNNDARHRVYSSYAQSNFANEGVFQAPQYIIEFLGHFALKEGGKRGTGVFSSACLPDSTTGKAVAPNDTWPYCAVDPAVYRITVRAVAGLPNRQSEVFLQSIFRVVK